MTLEKRIPTQQLEEVDQALPAVGFSRPLRGQGPGRLRLGLAGLSLAVLGLAACGGGGPLGNPPTVQNGTVVGQQKLSFVYFQFCVEPIFRDSLPIIGTSLTNTCAGAGCHDNTTGAGGAFRIVTAATPVPDSEFAAPDVVRNTRDMYKNYYSAQGEVVTSDPALSRLVNKPLVRGVLHGGGQIFASEADRNVQLLQFWMNNPVPKGQDEFSTSAAILSMFSPPLTTPLNTASFDRNTCRTQ